MLILGTVLMLVFDAYPIVTLAETVSNDGEPDKNIVETTLETTDSNPYTVGDSDLYEDTIIAEEETQSTIEPEEVTESEPLDDEESMVPEANVILPTEAFPSDLGRSDLYDYIKPETRASDQVMPRFSASNNSTPSKDFIDISSHNGVISVDQYKTMKSYGVKGVVVKLTEYTTYINPYAEGQIKNAQAAGLLVSVYHYSWFTSNSGAEKEAAYFAKAAANLKLPKSTIMVNDMEEPQIKGSANHTNTSVAFANKLKSLGYSNIFHYSSASWFNEGYLNANTLGKKNIWVAAYPYNIVKEQRYTDYNSWQWSSQLQFPGISGYFDISSDYKGSFVQSQTSTNKPTYYTSNPGYIIMKKADSIYSDVNFKTKKQSVAKGSIHKVLGVEYSSDKTPRLKVNGGYITANKESVSKIRSDYSSYYTTNPSYVSLKKDVDYYNSVNFTNATKGKKVAKGTVVKVDDIVFTEGGTPRIKTSSGYITANKQCVAKIRSDYTSYYTVKPSYIYTLKDIDYYKNTNFDNSNKKSKVARGTIVKVTGLEITSGGTPRLKTDKGYITANRSCVQKTVSTYYNYYYEANKVKTLKDIDLYSSVTFTANNSKKKIKKGQTIKVTGISFTEGGTPRLKVDGGYITANKSCVKK